MFLISRTWSPRDALPGLFLCMCLCTCPAPSDLTDFHTESVSDLRQGHSLVGQTQKGNLGFQSYLFINGDL